MTFEQELQALINKYGLKDVEITYKKQVTLSASTQQHVPTPSQATATGLVDEMESSPLLDAYNRGTNGTVT